MKIAIASGKGGTGKTTFAVALAIANRDRTRLLDCDVEEPNAHLFLRGEPVARSVVWASVPVVAPEICTGCGACVRFCQYNALAIAGAGGLLVFSELCHDCGGCVRICRRGALSEMPVERGSIETTLVGGDLELVTGRLEVGSPSAPTVIRALTRHPSTLQRAIDLLDSPPGTACSFSATVNAADFCIFVTDPTPFGLHDLALAIEAIQTLGKPFAVVINRSTGTDDPAALFCRSRGIEVMMTIPESRAIAEAYSRGETLLDVQPELGDDLRRIIDQIAQQVSESDPQ